MIILMEKCPEPEKTGCYFRRSLQMRHSCGWQSGCMRCTPFTRSCNRHLSLLTTNGPAWSGVPDLLMFPVNQRSWDQKLRPHILSMRRMALQAPTLLQMACLWGSSPSSQTLRPRSAKVGQTGTAMMMRSVHMRRILQMDGRSASRRCLGLTRSAHLTYLACSLCTSVHLNHGVIRPGMLHAFNRIINANGHEMEAEPMKLCHGNMGVGNDHLADLVSQSTAGQALLLGICCGFCLLC